MPLDSQSYEDLKKSLFDKHKDLGEPEKPSDFRMNNFKRLLKMVDHHDEYYTIMNNKTLELEWIYGLERVLGYHTHEWTHFKSLNIIHDAFREMYMNFGELFYHLLLDQQVQILPLKHRYIIYFPVKTSDGSFYWVKQMSMAFKIDTQMRMVRQINAYTVIARYQDVNLPSMPIIFDHNSQRMVDFEKVMFQRYFEKKPLNLSPFQLEILRAFVMADQEMCEKDKEQNNLKYKMPVTYDDVTKYLVSKRCSMPMIKKNASLINRSVYKSLNRNFQNTYQIAMFLKGLKFHDLDKAHL